MAVSSEHDPLHNTCAQRDKVHFAQLCASLDLFKDMENEAQGQGCTCPRYPQPVPTLWWFMTIITTPDCLPSNKAKHSHPRLGHTR